MSTLLFTNYNNYFNRTISRPNNSDAVAGYSDYVMKTMTDIDFNPNDGVETTVILEDFNNTMTGEPNYLVVYDPPKTTVDSRWFIIDLNRTRGSQWVCTLRRDVITDNLQTVSISPAMIEKGYLPYNNPLIFNSEQMVLNQIKQQEALIKDSTKLAWVVGYYTDQKSDGSGKIPHPCNIQFKNFVGALTETYSQLSDWSLYQFSTDGDTKLYNVYTDDAEKYTQITFKIDFMRGPSQCIFQNTIKITINGATVVNIDDNPRLIRSDAFRITAGPSSMSQTEALMNALNIQSAIIQYFNSNSSIIQPVRYITPEHINPTQVTSGSPNVKFLTTTQKNDIQQWINTNKIIHTTSDNKDYSISASKNFYVGNITYDSYEDTNNTLFNRVANVLTRTEFGGGATTLTGTKVVYSVVDLPYYSLAYYETNTASNKYIIFRNDNTVSANNDANEVYDLRDAPYNAVVMPYNPDGSSVDIIDKNGNIIHSLNSAVINTITKLASTSNWLDLQLLPYCPIERIFQYREASGDIPGGLITDYQFKISGNINYTDPEFRFIFVDDNEDTKQPSSLNAVVGIGFNMLYSSFSRNLPSPIIEAIETDSYQRKLKSDSRFYRINSPNYASTFEFNAQKDDGFTEINIECTYKPYSPYIQISPNFGGLYNKDFNDSRGLICRGSFSITQIQSQWREYGMQNINYQKTFDREMDSLELQHGASNLQKIAGIATNILSGPSQVISGGLQGLMGNGGFGALDQGGASAGMAYAGLAMGAGNAAARNVGRTFGATADLVIDKVLQNDQRDKLRTQFQYGLQNIQARPITISNISTFDINNKIFPFIELYDCTDVEKQIYLDNLKYNGMTIHAVGYLNDYVNKTSGTKTYLQGYFIRLLNSPTKSIDTHTSNAIYEEVAKGIYVFNDTLGGV